MISVLSIFTSMGCASNASFPEFITVYGDGKRFLNLFKLDKRLADEGVVAIELNRGEFDVLLRKGCPIEIYVKYLFDGGIGFDLRTIIKAESLSKYRFNIYDKNIGYTGGITVEYGVAKGQCRLDRGYQDNKNYYFPKGLLARLVKS